MKEENRLGYLDGLRGFAALWVLTGPLANIFRVDIPVLSSPVFAVDLFMILSGFLMYYHACLRQNFEPMGAARSRFIFWTRRFFRLAPSYYVVLAAAFFLTPAILPHVEFLLSPSEINHRAFADLSPENFWLHVTFLFGFFPEYGDRTALFDWSLALEMQFYLVFPFIFAVMARISPVKIAAALVLFSMAAWMYAGDYLAAFGQPAFLLLKINMFLSGMMIACAFFERDPQKIFSFVMAACVLAAMPLAYPFGAPSTVLRLLFVALMTGLVLRHRFAALPVFLQNSMVRLDNFLSAQFSRFLGDASYAVYLIHPLIMFPVAGWIASRLRDTPDIILFLLCLAVVTPLTYAAGWLLHLGVERPGIALGKTLTRALRPKTPAYA